MIEISVVVPVFNEFENVLFLANEIKVELDSAYAADEYEVIFVDDGSTDGTSEVLAGIPFVKILTFRCNSGQSAAMKAGIDHSKGHLIAFLDGDGQNDPSDICHMVTELSNSGTDLLCGWRTDREDRFVKRFISRGAYAIRQMLIKDGVHDSGCTLKVGYSACLKEMPLYGELHRLIPALVSLSGYKISETPVKHRARQFGTTKYNWKRTIKGFIDITFLWFWKKFESRPLHFFGGLGLCSMFLGGLSGLLATVLYLLNNEMFSQSLPLISTLLLLTGIQLTTTGLVADRLFRLHYKINNEPRYSLKAVRESL